MSGIYCPQATGEPLVRRTDDTPQVLEEKYRQYVRDIHTVLTHYSQKGKLVTVNASAVPNEVIHSLSSVTCCGCWCHRVLCFFFPPPSLECSSRLLLVRHYVVSFSISKLSGVFICSQHPATNQYASIASCGLFCLQLT